MAHHERLSMAVHVGGGGTTAGAWMIGHRRHLGGCRGVQQ
jgi:hypothetical protein